MGRVIGQTPLIDSRPRYDEVRQFLAHNEWGHLPWLALDDTPSHYPPDAPAHITNGQTGLNSAEVDELLMQYR